MALNGIDVASYQKALNLGNVSYDFVVIKATEGTTYVNPDCDTKYQAAKAAGKLRGIYMFVDHGGDPEAEADYFVDNCEGYIDDAILAVDWEGDFVSDTDYLHRILIRIQARTGVKPLAYMSEWVENAYDWSAVVGDDFGLWGAKYSDYEIDHDYDTSGAGTPPVLKHWQVLAMWQWTSVGILHGYAADLDCDIFYGNANTWALYAAVPVAPPSAPAEPVAPVAPAVPIAIPVTQADNDHDGAVPVATDAPVPAADADPVSVPTPAPTVTPAPVVVVAAPSKQTPLARAIRTLEQTIVGGVALITPLLTDPTVQHYMQLGLVKYVAPGLLGLGLSSGLVSLIINLIEDRIKPKTA